MSEINAPHEDGFKTCRADLSTFIFIPGYPEDPYIMVLLDLSSNNKYY
jgi:hypothetical protein